MTKILFIDAIRYWEEGREFETLVDNPGLLYLGSSIMQKFGPDYFDIKIACRDIEQHLSRFKPDIVGISSVTQNFNIAKKYASMAKSAGCSILVGGAHISALPNNLESYMDVGVVGEGEETIVELLSLYEKEKSFSDKNKISQIKGIVFRDDNGAVFRTEPRPLITPLDKIPFPARQLAYINKGVGIFTSRGCPYKCAFCFSTQHWNRIRFFSVDYVVNEIRELAKTYKYISIYDDLFVSNKKRLIEIVRELKKYEIPKHVTFNCNIRANHVDDETVMLLKEMNMDGVFIGIESGAQRTLTYLKGGNVTVAQNKTAIDTIKKYGIKCAAGIIIGSPTETKQEILTTLKFVKRSKLDWFYIFTLCPLPGTPVWDYALRKGLVSDRMDWDILRLEFGEIPKKAIVLSETLSRNELFSLYKLFVKEKRIRNFKSRIIPLLKLITGQVIKHPLVFTKKQISNFKAGVLSRKLKGILSLIGGPRT